MKANQGRTLALIDIENLVHGDPRRASAYDYVHAAALAAAHGGLTSAAQVVVGVGSNNETGIFAMAEAWPHASLRCRGGVDGADRALGEQLVDLAAVTRSFDEVVVGSGDHFFVDHVVALNELGIVTTVLSWSSKLSRRLGLAASQVRILDTPITFTSELDHVA